MNKELLAPSDTFVRRHLGPSESELAEMLEVLGVDSLAALADEAIPDAIRIERPLTELLDVPDGRGEHEVLATLRAVAAKNDVYRSFIGMGYYGCITPPVIQRNILENPGWYTQYTPYQAEIAQGRLEALLNFQTAVADLTGLPLANASLLDEATAAAEAMHVCQAVTRGKRPGFFVADHCHPQTISVVETRAAPMGIALQVGAIGDDAGAADSGSDLDAALASGELAGVLVQYPTTDGRVLDFAALAQRVHDAGALLVVATDLLALTLWRWGRASALACQWAAAAPTPGLSPPTSSTADRFPDAWSGCRATPAASPRIAWRCRPASSTSAAIAPPATSAPRRCCWPSWLRCTRSITAPRGCAGSPGGCARWPRSWPGA